MWAASLPGEALLMHGAINCNQNAIELMKGNTMQTSKVRALSAAILILVGLGISARAQTWAKVKHQPAFQTDTALLLTDGTVMMHEIMSPNWWRLTPDKTGSYLKGKWTKLASMQSTYSPLYFASQVLPDGRVLVEGGEYNLGSQSETNQGAIYDPVANTWTTVNPPSGWANIGDSPAIVLPNGTFFIGNAFSTQTAAFNPVNLTWSFVGSGKKDSFSEEGWTILPDGTVLTVDTENGTQAEKYIPSTSKWVSAGSTKVVLPNNGGLGIVPEMGPIVLLPNGTAFAMGATMHTATYTPPKNPAKAGTWQVGPDFPGGNDMADAPAAVLPSGNVLCVTSPGVFNNPVSVFEFDGTQFNAVPAPASAKNITSYEGRLLVLPTGQVLFNVADGATKDVEIYTPVGTYNPSWAPTITSVPATVTRGSTYQISGTQFNGLDAGAAYGDDVQMESNYPLVRITNVKTKHVFYARTHDHSTMGVATGSKTVSTNFDVPAAAETGASTIVVVANGIPSVAANVTVQ